jgi:hypothetical protein
VIETEGDARGAEVEGVVGTKIFDCLEIANDSVCHLVTCIVRGTTL